MQTFYLSSDHIVDLVQTNKHKVNLSDQFISRCIDDRYHNKDNPASLALPGADPGELALIIATGATYGFEVNRVKAFETLAKVVGGENHLQLHTDSHGEKSIFAGCGHMEQIKSDLLAYNLTQEDFDFIQFSFKEAKYHRAPEVVLEGEHKKNAVVLIRGDYGIYPRHYLEKSGQRTLVEVFEYHATLVDKRHEALAQMLIENKGVTLFEGCDAEYLFEALSDVGENHLMETLRRLAKGLPMYEVKFDKEGGFEIENLGNV